MMRFNNKMLEKVTKILATKITTPLFNMRESLLVGHDHGIVSGITVCGIYIKECLTC